MTESLDTKEEYTHPLTVRVRDQTGKKIIERSSLSKLEADVVLLTPIILFANTVELETNLVFLLYLLLI